MTQRLRIAIDITHPAHFHFFKNPIAEWRRRGHFVLILSRDKDLTLALLQEAGFDHHCLSKAATTRAGLALELVLHGARLWRLLGQHRIQVVAAIGGTFMVHAARLRQIPALVFYDTENARLSNRITYPLATKIYTPRAYRDSLGPKHIRYDGFHESAYLHPNYFTPDPAKLAAENLSPGERFTFVRLIAWNSHHDVGDYGVRDIRRVIQRLEQYGRVLVSSEAPLPDDLKRYEYRGRAVDVHHVLAFASLCFGESATMASESAQLGVPAIFLSTSSRGYTDDLERCYKLVFNFNHERAIEADALDCAASILSMPDARAVFSQRRKKLLGDQIDVAAFIVDEVERAALDRGRR